MNLKRKLMYRSWHRGCKEIDILLGNFALKHLEKFSFNELLEYEKIVNLDDHDLYSYITGKEDIPQHLSKNIFYLITSSSVQD